MEKEIFFHCWSQREIRFSIFRTTPGMVDRTRPGIFLTRSPRFRDTIRP